MTMILLFTSTSLHSFIIIVIIVLFCQVGEAAIQLECEVFELKPVMNEQQEHTVTLVIGKVIKFHILDASLTDKSLGTEKPVVDWTKLSPVARLGGDTYTVINNSFDLPRPDRKV